ncbi:hypothetical protein KK099_04225 [Curtobacterium flaccumfaciens pv. flaccumfaciens]|nr:hypothetical protein [Curtobacterium flaccumfaciens pv. flaccumfaciens]
MSAECPCCGGDDGNRCRRSARVVEGMTGIAVGGAPVLWRG